jgi:hypothetical protein
METLKNVGRGIKLYSHAFVATCFVVALCLDVVWA